MTRIEICSIVNPHFVAATKLQARRKDFLTWHKQFPYVKFVFDHRDVLLSNDKDVTIFCLTYNGKYRIIDS
jgi:hypothetical protein